MFASKTKHQSSSRDYNLTEITTKISDCVREYKCREKHNFRNEDLERDDSSDSYDDDETPASPYLRHYDGFSYYPSKSDLLVIYSIIVTIMQSENLEEALSKYKRQNIDWCINFISIIAPETVLQILTHNHVSDSSKMNIIELALEEVSKREEDSSYVRTKYEIYPSDINDDASFDFSSRELCSIPKIGFVPAITGWVNFLSFCAPHVTHPLIRGMTSWNAIPQFVILTGKNGVGKSEVLKLVRQQAYSVCGYFDHDIELKVTGIDGTRATDFENAIITNIKTIVQFLHDTKNPEEVSYLSVINSTFKAHDFPYKILTDGTIANILNEETGSILLGELSGGERWLIEVIIHTYSQELNTSTYTKIPRITMHSKALVWDEVDSRFEPSMRKKFLNIVEDLLIDKMKMQVIMTTHQPDTVSLPSSAEIFTMRKSKEGSTVIEPSSKLLAIARLTKNLHDHTNFAVKIYVEAFDDAYFYRDIYKILQKWEEGKDGHSRAFSNRWHPDFHSVCLVKGNDGGKGQVIEAIEREYSSYHKKAIKEVYDKNPNIVFPSCIKYPFGIVDNDNKRSEIEFKSAPEVTDKGEVDREVQFNNAMKARIEIPKTRYSLENYLCDPFFLSSLLTEEQIELIGNTEIKEALLGIKKAETEISIKENLHKYFAVFEDILLPKRDVENIVIQIIDTIARLKITDIFELPSDLSKEERKSLIKEVQQLWDDKPFKAIIKKNKEANEGCYKHTSILDSIKDYTKGSKIIVEPYHSNIISAIIQLVKSKAAPSYLQYAQEIKDIIQQHISTDLPHCVRITNIPGEVFTRHMLGQYDKDAENSIFVQWDYIQGSDTHTSESLCIINGNLKSSYEYPIHFLRIRGHDLVEKFGSTSFVKFILEELSSSEGRVCIPLDLIEVMSKLSCNIRSQINCVMKPTSKPSTKLYNEPIDEVSIVEIIRGAKKTLLTLSEKEREVESDAHTIELMTIVSVDNNDDLPPLESLNDHVMNSVRCESRESTGEVALIGDNA